VTQSPAAQAGSLQGGMSNAELTDAWRKKLPGVVPTERDLTAFALGVEVGAAQAAHSAPVAWRPIETAPTSGRGERPQWFLASNGHHIGVCARWADEGYGETIADESDEVVTPAPTHWMPLPAAPQTSLPDEPDARAKEQGEPT
jgi:hypothetical protein